MISFDLELWRDWREIGTGREIACGMVVSATPYKPVFDGRDSSYG